jgi:hypothetical protein
MARGSGGEPAGQSGAGFSPGECLFLAVITGTARRSYHADGYIEDGPLEGSLSTPLWFCIGAAAREFGRPQVARSSCRGSGIGFEAIAVAQRQRLIGATKGGEGIGGGSSGVPGPAMIFSENFFVACEGGFAESKCIGGVASGHKKARKIATHAICVWMLGADHFRGRQCALVITAVLPPGRPHR